MKIFLSHASEDQKIATDICLALRGAGYDVFFDADDLPPGGDYNSRIRTAIETSDAFIFLVSPHSVQAGGYTLSELKFARQKWPRPWGHVLPVMVGRTDWSTIDPYLTAVTVLAPVGNCAVEVVDALARLADSADARTESEKRKPSPDGRFFPQRKKKRLIAAFFLVAMLLIALLRFSTTARQLIPFFPDFYQASVSGEWRSEDLIDPRTGEKFSYAFDLKTSGGKLYGQALRVMPYCEENKDDAMCHGYGKPVPVLEGRLERKMIAFRCDWGKLPGASPWTWVQVQETFRGVIEKETIRFVQQDNQNSSPVEFLARRAPAR